MTGTIAMMTGARIWAAPGSEGMLVETLQRRLLELGYSATRVTGIWDDPTATAVRILQATKAVPGGATGVVDEATWEAVIGPPQPSVMLRCVGAWAWWRGASWTDSRITGAGAEVGAVGLSCWSGWLREWLLCCEGPISEMPPAPRKILQSLRDWDRERAWTLCLALRIRGRASPLLTALDLLLQHPDAQVAQTELLREQVWPRALAICKQSGRNGDLDHLSALAAAVTWRKLGPEAEAAFSAGGASTLAPHIDADPQRGTGPRAAVDREVAAMLRGLSSGSIRRTTGTEMPAHLLGLDVQSQ